MLFARFRPIHYTTDPDGTAHVKAWATFLFLTSGIPHVYGKAEESTQGTTGMRDTLNSVEGGNFPGIVLLFHIQLSMIWPQMTARHRHCNLGLRRENADVEADNRSLFAIHRLRLLDKTALRQRLAGGGIGRSRVQVGVCLSIVSGFDIVIIRRNDTREIARQSRIRAGGSGRRYSAGWADDRRRAGGDYYGTGWGGRG